MLYRRYIIMPKTKKSVYALTSRYRNQLLNQTLRNINTTAFSFTANNEKNVECNLESSVSSSSYSEINQSNLHDLNRLECEQQRNFEHNELGHHKYIIKDSLVASDSSAILNESSYDKYLKLYDLCEKCSLCICFLDCGECIHNEDYCQHCTKCNTVDYDNNYEETENFYEEFGTYYCEAVSFRDKLAQWALDTKINHHQLRSLLTILNSEHPEDKLPKDARTLMKTSLKLISLRNVSPGQYWHNGLAKQLCILYKNTNVAELKLTFNIDGVPISTSSSSVLWPILCSEEGSSTVFPVGIYHGYSKPDCSNIFLREFVDELKDLCQNGLFIDNRLISIKISFFCCDAPAKSFVLKICGNNAFYGCTKCKQKGIRIENRTSFPLVNCDLRNDEEFLQQSHTQYHKDTTILSEIPGFGLVSCFILDCMHLVCLGVMKKLLLFLLFGHRKVKISSKLINEISQHLISLKKNIPVKFTRKPRSLEFVCRYKATEFRLILLYLGPIIFRHLNKDIYNSFLSLHVEIRILASPNLCLNFNNYAHQLLLHFVESFKLLYGEEFVSHNIHGLTHLAQDVLKFGHLDNFSAFKFENFMQIFKHFIRKGEKPLQQIARRYSEYSSYKKETQVSKISFKGNQMGL